METSGIQTVCNTPADGSHCQGTVLLADGRIDAICTHDRQLMTEFSKVCIKRLGKYFTLRMFLSLFKPVLDANVLKEVEKDRMIISHAVAGLKRGREGTAADIEGLFEMTREVDNEFVRRLSTPLFSLEVRYEDFAEVRKRRIVSLINMVFDLTEGWRDELSFIQNVKNTYTEKRYREVIGELLHLYNLETRMLSNSFTLYGPAVKMRDLFAEKLFATMERTAEDLCAEYTRRVYSDEGRPDAA